MKKNSTLKKIRGVSLASISLLAMAPSPVVAFDDSGKNSYFWVTLKPQAGTNGADNDVIMRNGYREETLRSNRVSCSRSEVGLSLIHI